MSIITGAVGVGLTFAGLCCCITSCSFAANYACDVFARRLAADIHPDLTADQVQDVVAQMHEIEEGSQVAGVEVMQIIVQRALGYGTPAETRVGSPEMNGNNSIRIFDVEEG